MVKLAFLLTEKMHKKHSFPKKVIDKKTKVYYNDDTNIKKGR